MADVNWQPAGELEEHLRLAREDDDQLAFLARLARADVFCPQTGGEPAGWMMTEIAGRRYALGFTSKSAMERSVGAQPYRLARFRWLARGWPDPDVWFAVNPGTPIDLYCTPVVVTELADAGSQPGNAVEFQLERALSAGDVEQYLNTLLATDVLVPVGSTPGLGVEDSSAATDAALRALADPTFPWLRLGGDGPVAVFTSGERLRDILVDASHLTLPFAALVTVWPETGLDLAIDQGATYGGQISAEVIRALGARIIRAVSPAVHDDPST